VSLLAALSIGAFSALLVGNLLGQPLSRGRWPRSRPGVSAAQLWLNQAGVALSPRQFVIGSTAVGAVAFGAGTFLTGAVLVAVVPAVAVATLPRAYFGRRRAAKLREIQVAWPDGLRDLAASIAAGHSLTRAVTNLAETGPDPLRVAFARFPMLARMFGTVPALEVVKEELADPTSDRVIEVLILSYERGGSIVKQILDDLVVATTKDVKVLEEIESEGLEMQINARAVLVMPWFVLVALTLRAGPFREFYRSSGGVFVVLVGAALSGLGSLWISRLGRRHEEQRVFGSARLTVSRHEAVPQ
jgi:tight adherence protein B